MARLADLPFSDLYIPLPQADGGGGWSPHARYNPSPLAGAGRVGNLPVPEEYAREIAELGKAISKQPGAEFSINFPQGTSSEYDGVMRLRVAKQRVFDEQQWACCRRFFETVPPIETLGFAAGDLAAMSEFNAHTGLLVISGATGEGKTTTAVALLRHYLEKRGGVAVTIEDPVEYVLQGEVGSRGFCYQVPVSQDVEWAEAIKISLRWAPRFIFCGEIRTPSAATQLIQAASSGHLVICTIHGGATDEALQRLIQIASAEMGDTARLLVANSLVATIHQRLLNGRPQISLLSAIAEGGGAIRGIIRDSKLEQLGTALEQQAAHRRKRPITSSVITQKMPSGGASGAGAGEEGGFGKTRHHKTGEHNARTQKGWLARLTGR